MSQETAITQHSPAADAISEDDESYLEGEEARKAFPTQVAAALSYAADNKYDYGPKLRNAQLQWDIDRVELQDSGIARVYLRFRPSESFRGEAGSEYLDIDSDGAVLARRQLHLPKEQLPILLIGLAVVSLISMGVVLGLQWVYNPFEAGPDLYVSGRILWVRAELPDRQPFIVYDAPSLSGEAGRWSIAPVGDGTELVIIETTLINQTSGAVNMVVDRDAAQLRIRGSISLKPIDIIDASYPVEGSERRNLRPDFRGMWGSITLNQGEQITGHMVFEAPVRSEFSEFRWLAGDTAVVRY